MKKEKLYLVVTAKFLSWGIENNLEVDFIMQDNDIGQIKSAMGDELVGSMSRPILRPNIEDEFWKSNVEEIFLYEYFNFENTSYVTLFYSLKPKILDKILKVNNTKNNSEEKNKIFDLIYETFPDIENIIKKDIEYKEAEIDREKKFEKHKNLFANNAKKIGWSYLKDKIVINTENKFEKYKKLFAGKEQNDAWFYERKIKWLDSYLIIVPAEQEVKKLNQKKENETDFLIRFERSIKRNIEEKKIRPYYYVDYIETIHETFIKIKKMCLRVLLCTKNYDKNKGIVIPYSVRELHEFGIKLNLLKNIKEKLSSLYAYKNDIEEYIKAISKKNIFKNYSLKYKNDRLSYIKTKFYIAEKVNEIKYETKNKMPYILKDRYDKYLLKGLCSNENFYNLSRLENNNIEFESLKNYIEENMQEITLKDNYINEYIRDVISIESMWGNLKIQKLLRLVTIIALLIGILSVVLSIYGAEIKEIVYNFFR